MKTEKFICGGVYKVSVEREDDMNIVSFTDEELKMTINMEMTDDDVDNLQNFIKESLDFIKKFV